MHAEYCLPSELGRDQPPVLRVAAEHLGGKGLVGRLGHGDLLVQHVQHTAPAVEQGHAIRVVGVVNVLLEPDALLGTVLQLRPEDVVIELQLQVLVAEVDKELLQGVAFEALEAADVQDAKQAVSASHDSRRCLIRGRAQVLGVTSPELLVHPPDEPLEQAPVEHPAEPVAHGPGLVLPQGRLRDVLAGDDLAPEHAAGQRPGVHSQELRGAPGGRIVLQLRALRVAREVTVPQGQRAGNNAEDPKLLILCEAQCCKSFTQLLEAPRVIHARGNGHAAPQVPVVPELLELQAAQ
mmetsp:Transcript_25942/g.78359  ORF Transcript_25942/g.78359 Transcript_25942/m.78359 type:complete len:294 (+) Transcript_25942:649-1530(+)